jgi:hypothetical protein
VLDSLSSEPCCSIWAVFLPLAPKFLTKEKKLNALLQGTPAPGYFCKNIIPGHLSLLMLQEYHSK